MVCIACGKEFDDNRMNCPFCNAAADSDDMLDFELLDAWEEDDERELLEFEAVTNEPEERFLGFDEKEQQLELEEVNGEEMDSAKLQNSEGTLDNAKSQNSTEALGSAKSQNSAGTLDSAKSLDSTEALDSAKSLDSVEPLEFQEIQGISGDGELLELEEAKAGEQESLDILEMESVEAIEAYEEVKLELEEAEGAWEASRNDSVEIDLEPVIDEFEAYEIKIKVKEYDDNELMLKTEDILYTLKEDKRRVKGMICLLVASIGSFFNFWGISTELIGKIKMGSLFSGYGLGGILGKLCVLAALAGIGLLVVNLIKYAFASGLIACIFMLAQGLTILFYSWSADFEYANAGSVFFDWGFYITAVFLVVALIYLRKINGGKGAGTDGAKEKKNA